MKIFHRLALAVLACASAFGCTPSRIHLVGEESARKGDIQITGNIGNANWSWGPQQFAQQLDVTDNKLVSAAGVGGGLTLKLRDGTALEFAGEHGVLVCSGCEEVHMPMLWRQVK